MPFRGFFVVKIQERETKKKMDEFNWTYYHNVNNKLVQVFFPFEAVISNVGGIYSGSRVISSTSFDDDCDAAVVVCPGSDLIFLTSRWWDVLEGEVTMYHVEGMAVMQSSQPFIIRPVNWPEKNGWSFRIAAREGETGWRKI
jgi:hypothetical protein